MIRFNKKTAYLCLFLSMAIAGSAVVVSKILTNTLPVFFATEGGLFLALLFLLPFTFLYKKEKITLSLKSHGILFLQGLLGILGYRLLLMLGLKNTSAATSGLLISASPILVAILAYFILKETVTWMKGAGIALVMIGLCLANGNLGRETFQNRTTMTGTLFVMGAVFCESLFLVLSKTGDKRITPLFRTTMVSFYAFVCLLPFSIYEGLQVVFLKVEPVAFLCILYYGLFVSVLSYLLWFQGALIIPANQAAAWNGVVPMSSILLSAVILKESISLQQLTGLCIIVVGISLTSFGSLSKKLKLENSTE